MAICLLFWALLPSCMQLCTMHSLERQESAARYSVNHCILHISFFPILYLYISILFAMCICTTRPLSFQMVSCLLHSGFHLEELLCICLRNYSQLCSSYQSVTGSSEIVHALLDEDHCCDPPAFKRIGPQAKSSAISFSQQSCSEQTTGPALLIFMDQS